MKTKETIKIAKRSLEHGFTMLEYAAGAAVLAGVVYAAMSYFGGGLESFFTALGDWATNQSGQIYNP